MNTDDLELRAFVLPGKEQVIEVDKETRYRGGEILMMPTQRKDNTMPTELEGLQLTDINKVDLVKNIFDSLKKLDHQLREVKIKN